MSCSKAPVIVYVALALALALSNARYSFYFHEQQHHHHHHHLEFTYHPDHYVLPSQTTNEIVGTVKSASISNTHARNTTLVVLLGNLRCGEHAWQSLYRNVLDVNNADLAIITQQLPSSDHVYLNSTLFKRAMYAEYIPNFVDWADAIDMIQNGNSSWRERVLPLYNFQVNTLLGGVGNASGSGAIIFWYRWYLSQIIIEQNWLERYERFIITRNDHYYECAHDIHELDNRYLWLPQGEDYAGLTDRHLVVSSEHVLQALNILPPLLQDPQQYKRSLQKSNTEQFLRYRWKQQGLLPLVRRFRRSMFTCGLKGIDESLWGQLQQVVPPGVNIKYPTEYNATVDTCRNNYTTNILPDMES